MAAPQPKKRTEVRPAFDIFSVQIALREKLSAREKLSGLLERDLLGYIWERTWAKSRKPGDPPPEWARISSAEFARACGCKGKYAGDVIQRALARLRKVGIIAARKQGRDQILYYKLVPENWESAPKYELPKPMAVALPRQVLQTSDIPDLEELEEPEAAPEYALPGLEHIALATEEASRIKLTLGDDVEVVNHLPLRVEIDKRLRKGVTQLILREENKRSSGLTPDLQVGGQKSGNAEGERQRLRKGLKLGGDDEMVELLYQPLAKSKESAADFVAFIEQKQRSRKSEIKRAYLPGILKEFLGTPAEERDLGFDDAKYQRDYELAMKGDNAAAERCLKRGRR